MSPFEHIPPNSFPSNTSPTNTSFPTNTSSQPQLVRGDVPERTQSPAQARRSQCQNEHILPNKHILPTATRPWTCPQPQLAVLVLGGVALGNHKHPPRRALPPGRAHFPQTSALPPGRARFLPDERTSSRTSTPSHFLSDEPLMSPPTLRPMRRPSQTNYLRLLPMVLHPPRRTTYALPTN